MSFAGVVDMKCLNWLVVIICGPGLDGSGVRFFGTWLG